MKETAERFPLLRKKWNVCEGSNCCEAVSATSQKVKRLRRFQSFRNDIIKRILFPRIPTVRAVAVRQQFPFSAHGLEKERHYGCERIR